MVIFLCPRQAFAALLLLGEGGVFVCKLFECWTESTAALVYLMHRKFRQIAIVKPITRWVFTSVSAAIVVPRFSDCIQCSQHILR